MSKVQDIWRALPRPAQRLLITLALVQLGLIAVHLIAYASTLDAAIPKQARQPLDFNQEDSIQTFWSALVLLAAGAAAFEAGRVGGPERRRSVAWLLVGLGFIWLALEEELVHLHENIQIATGVDWPIFYLPALVIGCWTTLRATTELERPLRPVLLTGLLLLAVAVGAELLSSPSIHVDFMVRNLIEENLELLGASLVLIAALAHGPRFQQQREPSPALLEPRLR